MESVENENVKFWIDKGIMYSEFNKEITLDLDNSKKIIDLRHQISNNEKQYWCYSFAGVKSMSKESRDYAEKHGQDFLYASAAVINSHLTSFIVNTFTLIKKPRIPFKAFKTKEAALKWLLEIKKQNELKHITKT